MPRRNYADPRVPPSWTPIAEARNPIAEARNLDCGNTAIWLTAVYHYPTRRAAKGSSPAEALGRVRVIRG